MAPLAPEAATRARDDFFLTLSHELRGPLHAILTWVYLLRSGKLDDATAARALETIERNAQAEARLVGDMLDVSRMMCAKIRLVLRPVNLTAVVAESVETVRPEIDEGDLHVEIDSPPAIDSIIADPDRLHQVLENLLRNAIKFTPRGGRITVRIGRDAQCATITVSDTGQGIRADILPHVFERFWQSGGAATRLGGLGLGLAIVKHLVELHGGTVKATSNGEGKGTTFIVTLPTHHRSDGVESSMPVPRQKRRRKQQPRHACCDRAAREGEAHVAEGSTEATHSDERAPAGAEVDVARGAEHVRRDPPGRPSPGNIDR